jgi:hypothetical protein
MVAPTVATTSWSRPGEAVVLFCRGRTARTAGPTAAIVGTLLSAVNQGEIVLAGEGNFATWLRIAVNYLVPYTVASIGFLSARRAVPCHPPDRPGLGGRPEARVGPRQCPGGHLGDRRTTGAAGPGLAAAGSRRPPAAGPRPLPGPLER